MAKKTGIIEVRVRGKTLEGMPGTTVDFGGMTRTPVIANNKVVGYTETPVPSIVDVTLPHGADTDIDELRNMVGVVLVVKPDAGPSYMIKNAFSASSLVLSDAGGGFKVQFQGEAAEKL